MQRKEKHYRSFFYWSVANVSRTQDLPRASMQKGRSTKVKGMKDTAVSRVFSVQ